ncbi:MAG: 2-oxo acid dehydrogenase subunit E2, partial [Nocardioides sp.]
MRERYTADPGSVDATWVDYFTDGGGASSSSSDNGSGANGSATNGAAPAKAEPKPEPKPEPKAEVKPEAKSEAKSEAKPAPVAKPRPQTKAAEPAKGTSDPMPKESRPAEPAAASDEPTYTVLRGAPARTAHNMDASLTVPTATSVRTVPVKLLWDNRTVINNHLARARGGKVSFTHLIGYALVKALRAMPEMNVGFDVIDGKPNLITPAHINLGLAIDVKKDNGTRQLLVPSIKAAESMDFAAFWTAYEEIVRKTRDGKLAVEDFQGTTISLTNPGGIG